MSVPTTSTAIDPDAFVAAVKPALEKRDLAALLNTCKSHWTAAQIVGLLSCDHCDARKVAALALSLVGCPGCLTELAKQLKDTDPMVNQMAEHAMWNIWFRCGTPEANHQLGRGVAAMDRRDIPHAIHHFNKAITMCPNFAEAYNQRALAKFLLEHYEASLTDCRRAVELNPDHFGAWAGLGHCYAHLGDCGRAIDCYEKSLSINPHMCGIREAVQELHGCVREKQ